jgi:predicted TPR repeat methyltransferase
LIDRDLRFGVQPHFMSSGDLLVDRRYQWALDYLARGDRAAAADILEQVVAAAPAFTAAWFALGDLREAADDRAGAIAAFAAARDTDPQDQHGARLRLARLGVGEATPALMEAHVRRLFDQHAPGFDASLRHLNYCGPQLLAAAVAAVQRAAGRPTRFGAMLDLGCGTGLVGAAFRADVDHLTGVDISAAMTAEARRRALYDQLETGELLEFLAAEEAAGRRYGLVVAADVLVYVRDLARVAAAVRQVLAPAGLFAFTVESHAGEGVLLCESLRYAHSATCVRAAMAGLELVRLEEVATRTERRAPVPGLLGIASAC